MFNQKKWFVIMVFGNSLQIVGDGETAIQSIALPSSIVNNMEVINKDALYTLITDWLKQRTYASAEVVWILPSEICFEHLLRSTETNEMDSETIKFLDTVPFEEILHRIYLTQSGRQIVAVNKSLVMSLIQAFSLHGYITQAVVPARLAQAESSLTVEIAHHCLKHLVELEKESIVASLSGTHSSDVSLASPVKSKSSLPLLLAVFGALFAILLYVIYLNQ